MYSTNISQDHNTLYMEEIEQKYRQERAKIINLLPKLLFSHNVEDILLTEAEKLCDFPPSYSSILFPNGLVEVMDEFAARQDQIMLERFKSGHAPIKIREKIALYLNLRIMALDSRIVQRIASYYVHPANSAAGLKLAWRTANVIWRACGDESIDFNYYTKRSLLSSVYLSAILFYIQDNSQNYEQTTKFIKEAIENIIKIGSLKNRCKLPEIENIPILRLFA